MTHQHQVTVSPRTAQPLLVAHGYARDGRLAEVLIPLLDRVYAYLKEVDLKAHAGCNVAIYRDGGSNGVSIAAGVQFDLPAPSNGTVFKSATPEGEVASTLHLGPYQKLGLAHDAIRTFAARHGYTLTGPRWEIYGDWDEDETKLETEVCYLVQPRR